MEISEIKELAETLLKTARKNLETDGRLIPFVMVFSDVKSATVVSLEGLDEEFMPYTLQDAVDNAEAHTAIIVVDMYVKKFKDSEAIASALKPDSLSEDPDTCECLVAFAASADTSLTLMQRYRRNENRTIEFLDGLPEEAPTLCRSLIEGLILFVDGEQPIMAICEGLMNPNADDIETDDQGSEGQEGLAPVEATMLPDDIKDKINNGVILLQDIPATYWAHEAWMESMDVPLNVGGKREPPELDRTDANPSSNDCER